MPASAFVSWPSAPLTDSLVRRALAAVRSPCSLTETIPAHPCRLVQWSTYDEIDHELAHSNPANVLISSYTIRKALIRKHFLSRCLQSYLTKHPRTPLKHSIPRAWDIDISSPEDLDEMWVDDLWDLAVELDNPTKWWILKPGMADRGYGIRLFNSKDALRQIFESFETDWDEDEDSDTTAVITSQLRHFVLQEYFLNPLLLDPSWIQRGGQQPFTITLDEFHGHKVSVVSLYAKTNCALKVYLYPRVLALFSAVPYSRPVDGDPVDLTPHLTNTSLQTHRGEEGVFLLDELIGCPVVSFQGPAGSAAFTAEDVAFILDEMCKILAGTFKAALENPIHFQPLPNAFELFGVDFLVTHEHELDPLSATPPSRGGLTLGVKLLEFNAEPAIELTGPRLTWILEDLFVAMSKVCVEPFISIGEDLFPWTVGETRNGLRKCLDKEVWGTS